MGQAGKARQVSTRTQALQTDRHVSIRLAHVSPYGLATLSCVSPQTFRDLRQTSRCRRSLVGDCSRLRNRIHRALDHRGLHLLRTLTNILGMNGCCISDGVMLGKSAEGILNSLSGHVRRKRDLPPAIWLSSME